MHHERIAILDYGSQYTRLITRRLRELGAFGLVYGPQATAAEIAGADLKGVILSGGPNSVLEPGAPGLDPAILELGVPVLGVCYGMQLLARDGGGQLHRAAKREYGKATVSASPAESLLFKGMDPEQVVWMSHGDHVEGAPAGYAVTARTPGVPVAAMEHAGLRRSACGVFLSRLCGGEPPVWKVTTSLKFLSRLCGGERLADGLTRFWDFLSRLCGGEWRLLGICKIENFLSRLCGGERKAYKLF